MTTSSTWQETAVELVTTYNRAAGKSGRFYIITTITPLKVQGAQRKHRMRVYPKFQICEELKK
jgi:hypothetical protein